MGFQSGRDGILMVCGRNKLGKGGMGYKSIVDYRKLARNSIWDLLFSGSRRRIPSFGHGRLEEWNVFEEVGDIGLFFAV